MFEEVNIRYGVIPPEVRLTRFQTVYIEEKIKHNQNKGHPLNHKDIDILQLEYIVENMLKVITEKHWESLQYENRIFELEKTITDKDEEIARLQRVIGEQAIKKQHNRI